VNLTDHALAYICARGANSVHSYIAVCLRLQVSRVVESTALTFSVLPRNQMFRTLMARALRLLKRRLTPWQELLQVWMLIVEPA
jgi:hypothetical protein